MDFFKTTKSITVSSAVPAAAIDPDVDLVTRVQSGDTAAFDQLILKYRERLYNVAYNMTTNHEDASDIAQEAFIKAFSSIKSFKRDSIFYTWLYRILINTTLTHLKKYRKRRFFSLNEMESDSSVMRDDWFEKLAEQRGGEKNLLLRELQDKLNEAMQRLTENHRTVVVLYDIEGLTHQEIAQITDTNEGTVRSRLHYAREQLQSYLKDYIN